jgi:hypothetical protein
MRITNRCAAAALALMLGIATSAPAQGGPVKVKEEKPGMFKLAKLTPDSATKLAQAQFPKATIKSGEIEKEDGKLIYTFDIQQPGVKGIEEVNIDALTGALTVAHENPAPPKPKTPQQKPAKPPTD